MQTISIKLLVIASLSLLGVVVIGLSVFSSFQFKEAAIESQSQSLSRSVEVAAREILVQLQDQGTNLAEDTQKGSDLRAVFTQLLQTPEETETRQTAVEILNSQFHQRYVTAGILILKKLRLYDKNLNLIVSSSEGVTNLDKNLPKFLSEKAQGREGADRYKALGGIWLSNDEALYSVLAPIGGLRLLGYIEVVMEPAYNLRKITEIMQVPVQIHSWQKKELFKSDDWQQNKYSLNVHHDVLNTEGKPAIHLTVIENVETLFTRINNMQWFTISLFVVVILVTIGIFLLIFKLYLFEPLKMLVNGLERCASGDLTVEIQRNGLKDMYTFSGALVTLVESLRQQVGEIQNHAASVSQAAEQLQGISIETTEGMDKQQQQTEQLSTAMNQMVATVREVSNSAVQAASGTGKATEQAGYGKQLVQDSIQGNNKLAGEVERASEVINDLKNKSNDISSVLDVIKDIAEQTNLLALNAAIEAARAGEQGRGFAVVADEVRTLATRTQQSTLEIQTIVESFQQESHKAVSVMDEGKQSAQNSVQQVHTAGESLDSIVETVKQINDMNNQIASAAEQQSAVAEEINRNIIEINTVTEKTAENTKQTSSSCQNLAQLADKLQQMVSHFRI